MIAGDFNSKATAWGGYINVNEMKWQGNQSPEHVREECDRLDQDERRS